MIDWHGHILPGIDDGSKDAQQSISMLRMLKEQKVSTAVATPHFYADHNSVNEFLEKRDLSEKKLKSVIDENLPEIILGAEVCYYPGIGKLSGLDKLCIGNTDILLLEMPMSKWTKYTVGEISELADSGEFTLMLAHIDRYMQYQDDVLLKNLRQNGILMQINASFVNGFTTRRKALKLLYNGTVQFIGSDCHNLDTRRPRIGEAFDNVRKKLGDSFIEQFNDFGYSMLR